MGRSLRVSKEGLKRAKTAFNLTGWTQEYLAGSVKCTRPTVNKFLAGGYVEKRIFEALCGELKLTVAEIADFESEEEQLSKSLDSNGSRVQTLQENISESSQEECSTMGGLTEPLAGTKEQNQTEEERLGFAIVGSVAKTEMKKFKAVVGVLQKITGDTSLEIVDIEKGSIRLILEGSQESLEQIEALFKSGQLKEVEGIQVEDVQILAPNVSEHGKSIKVINKVRLAFTITGNLSSEEIQELKAVFADNSDKDGEIKAGDKSRLVQKNTTKRAKGLNLRLTSLDGADLSGVDLVSEFPSIEFSYGEIIRKRQQKTESVIKKIIEDYKNGLITKEEFEELLSQLD
jgi:transcriptional regulator with XRE-family HTH domain